MSMDPFSHVRGTPVSDWFDDALYRQLSDEKLFDPLPPEPAMSMLPSYEPLVLRRGEPVAVTAGEQDHSDPWLYAAEVAGPPVNP
jgi:hypothetical protein